MNMDYEQFRIREYNQWELFLHQNQYPYIGRCYAWARRKLADTVLDMNSEEREELFEVLIPAWYEAAQKLFHCDRPNVAILGNEAPHLHAHLIPRCKTQRVIDGMEFIDPNPHGNYAPYPKKQLPLEFLIDIRDRVREAIGTESTA